MFESIFKFLKNGTSRIIEMDHYTIFMNVSFYYIYIYVYTHTHTYMKATKKVRFKKNMLWDAKIYL